MALCRRCGLFGTLLVSSWLALRAAVLRLAVSTGALPGTAALGLLVGPGPSYAPPCFHGFRIRPVQWPAEARCPTLPSRGPAPASRVGPLMSNVERLVFMRTSSRSLLRSWVRRLGRPSAFEAEPPAHGHGASSAVCLAHRTWHEARFRHHRARSLLGAGIRLTGSRLLVRSQTSLVARAGGGRTTRPLGCARSNGRLVCTRLPPPNYSIERTRPGKPGRASHVKR
jgi:hypothetical protein